MGLFSKIFKRQEPKPLYVDPKATERRKLSGRWKAEPRYDKDGKFIAGVYMFVHIKTRAKKRVYLHDFVEFSATLGRLNGWRSGFR